MTAFQTRLRELRSECGFTQKGLAEQLNTTSDSIYSWEKGRSEPSIAMICKLCHILDVSADYLLGVEDETNTKSFR